jgi:hypothetical protein
MAVCTVEEWLATRNFFRLKLTWNDFNYKKVHRLLKNFKLFLAFFIQIESCSEVYPCFWG